MQVGDILTAIDLHAIALPRFQRGYVWNREQVRGLMHSLYHRYPAGSLLVWVTHGDATHVKGGGELPDGVIRLLLDGQQRITTLYGIVRGKPPEFFEGNVQAFTGLHFHLEDETFEFYSAAKMADNPLWVNVTEFMQKGMGEFMMCLLELPQVKEEPARYIDRLNSLAGIKDVTFHIEEVAGADKTVDVVVDVFNRVNSSGTKLSKGDLALARICALWPDARQKMNRRLEKWRSIGYDFRLDWLLRNITTILTGKGVFSALKDVDVPTFQKGLGQAEKAIDYVLNLISSRLGLHDTTVLGGSAAIPVMTRYFVQRGGKPLDHAERDKLLYWYVHTFLWGRYTGSSESTLGQDLGAIEEPNGNLDALIEQLRRSRGSLRVQPEDFMGWSRGARFYPLLYMLTRVYGARDWGSGLELCKHILGKAAALQLHHIFPKARLYELGWSTAEVNALANLTFLTTETNLEISDQEPAVYLPKYLVKQPGAVRSHWIPEDPDLWRFENYSAFLAERRALLAAAANSFLEQLLAGAVPESALQETGCEILGSIASAEEEALLTTAHRWVVEQGLPQGQFVYEVADPQSGKPMALLDLAWPEGLQAQLSEPVALLLGESVEMLQAANRAGFRYFTNVAEFQRYVEQEVLGLR